MTARAEPFTAERYDLGPVVLEPIGDVVAELAERLAAIDPWARTGRTAAGFLASFAVCPPATFRFALRRDGRLVGYLALRRPFMRGPYVETIAVFPEAQRLGIARAVIEWAAREVEGLDTNLWLCVTEWNAVARAAYAALGFVDVGPLPDVAAVGVTEIFMRRVLAPPMP
ncbi:MAG: GNAT family N-acetyltransferase [Siculibacillus sp.]